MAGLIGSMLAGGIKKVADTRLEDIDEKERFDYQQALLEANFDRNLQLKKAGIQLTEESAQRERDRIGKIAKDNALPEDTAGGYETDEMKAERERKQNAKLAKAYEDSGDLDTSKFYQGKLAASDKTAMDLEKIRLQSESLDAKSKIAEQQLELRRQLGEAKNENERARIEAMIAKNEAQMAKDAAGKTTQEDKGYASYVEEMKRQGKTPLPLYRWQNWMESKKQQFKGESGTTTVKTIDETTGAEISTTTRSKPTSKAPLKPWERKY